jgi:DICT domain-containing protein
LLVLQVAVALAHSLLEQLLAVLAHRDKALLAALVKTAHLTRTHRLAAVAVVQAQSVSMRVLLVAMAALVQQTP